MKLIRVDGIFQIGPGADEHRGDCGIACVCTCIKAITGLSLTPDAICNQYGIGVTEYSNAARLKNIIVDYGLTAYISYGVGLESLRKLVDSNYLSIVLINYKPLADAGITQFPGDFVHWGIVVGYDDTNIFLFDPYRTDKQQYIIVPNIVFSKASLGNVVTIPHKITGEYMSPIPHTTHIVIAPNGLNVRKSPSVTSDKIGYLTYKELVMIELITDPNWVKLTGPRLTGYISALYIQPKPEEVPVPIDDSATFTKAEVHTILLDLREKAKVELNKLIAWYDAELAKYAD